MRVGCDVSRTIDAPAPTTKSAEGLRTRDRLACTIFPQSGNPWPPQPITGANRMSDEITSPGPDDADPANAVAGLIMVREHAGHRIPLVESLGESIGQVVHRAHETHIDDAAVELAAKGISRDEFDALLVYCAERRCEADTATCPGCRRRTLADGLETVDDFIAAHEQIAIGTQGAILRGTGARRASFASMEDLIENWGGQEYWYWSRRVLRKLRHGLRRADIRGEPIAGEGETPSILLMEPQLADNIGMVARAMANFGLDDLRLIAPRDGWPNEKARTAASGANYVVDDARAFQSLEGAMGDLNWVCATTARQRDMRKPVLTPEQAIAEISRRIADGQRCGILFGRERNGLQSDEVANADAIVMIPVNSRFASLNLAQAVLILGYAWMLASDKQSLGRVTTYERPLSTGFNIGGDRPATKAELVGFYEHLEAELERLGFFHPPHRRAAVVRSLRTMFARTQATEQEVRTLRGIVATLAKGKGAGRKA